MKFDIVGTIMEGHAMLFGQVAAANSRYNALQLPTNPFSCCGITALRGFGAVQLYAGNNAELFKQKAAFLAGLWKTSSGRTHFVYILNHDQKRLDTTHKALLECGSVEVCAFPNLQPHHGNTLYMFVANLNEGIGKFFDRNGVPFEAPPAEAKPAVESTVKVKAKPSSKTAETV